MTNLEYGPDQLKIISGLDYYKPTMSQLEFDKDPNAQVTFTFKNRGEDISGHIDIAELQRRLKFYKEGWDDDEINFLAKQQRSDGVSLFSYDYLSYLAGRQLPDISVDIDPVSRGVRAFTTGDWPMVTFWETVVMSEVNELYFETKIIKEGLDLMAIYDEGDKRLSEKIAILQARPDIKISDFGTRRHFSRRWHEYVVGRLVQECPDNLLGTSNVWLAKKLGIKPIGTFAHEMPMVYAALEDAKGNNPINGHRDMLVDWRAKYGDDLLVALTDTFGSEYFFADFTPEQARKWQALRHDSGDAVEFGYRVIDFYKRQGIDPATKTIVFSDSLDIDKIVELADEFKGKIKLIFGWGTTLTNDLGLEPLNIVMKATCVNGTNTVKLSDDEGKHTGTDEDIERYKKAINSVISCNILEVL